VPESAARRLIGSAQQAQVIVISVQHTVARHGDEFAPVLMQTQSIEVVIEACFGGEPTFTIIAQDSGLTLLLTLCVTQVVEHE
jgi:hypothetical protein